MAQEMVRYTETHRDQLELELAEQADKLVLNERYNNGIKVIAYWLRKENICTIWLQDERTNSACEFAVPNQEVMDWFTHPYAHIDAQMPRYVQGSNSE